MSEQTDMFSSRSQPSFLRNLVEAPKGPPKRTSGLPVPRPRPTRQPTVARHFVFSRVSSSALRSIPRRPWVWPPHDEDFYPDLYFRRFRCRHTDELAFERKDEVYKFMGDMKRSNIFEIWHCEFCDWYHFSTYPADLGGQSDGKAVRLYYWNLRRGVRTLYGKHDSNTLEPCKLFLRRHGFPENVMERVEK